MTCKKFWKIDPNVQILWFQVRAIRPIATAPRPCPRPQAKPFPKVPTQVRPQPQKLDLPTSRKTLQPAPLLHQRPKTKVRPRSYLAPMLRVTKTLPHRPSASQVRTTAWKLTRNAPVQKLRFTSPPLKSWKPGNSSSVRDVTFLKMSLWVQALYSTCYWCWSRKYSVPCYNNFNLSIIIIWWKKALSVYDFI